MYQYLEKYNSIKLIPEEINKLSYPAIARNWNKCQHPPPHTYTLSLHTQHSQTQVLLVKFYLVSAGR